MSYQKLSRNQIAERVAQDIPDGAYVNLRYWLTDQDCQLPAFRQRRVPAF